MNELFENQDPARCPIIRCELRTLNCEQIYSGQGGLRITPNTAFDFRIISSNNDYNLERL